VPLSLCASVFCPLLVVFCTSTFIIPCSALDIHFCPSVPLCSYALKSPILISLPYTLLEKHAQKNAQNCAESAQKCAEVRRMRAFLFIFVNFYPHFPPENGYAPKTPPFSARNRTFSTAKLPFSAKITNLISPTYPLPASTFIIPCSIFEIPQLPSSPLQRRSHRSAAGGVRLWRIHYSLFDAESQKSAAGGLIRV